MQDRTIQLETLVLKLDDFNTEEEVYHTLFDHDVMVYESDIQLSKGNLILTFESGLEKKKAVTALESINI